MYIRGLCSDTIPDIDLSEKAVKALSLVEDLKLSAVPITDKGKLKGVISEEVLLNNLEVEKIQDLPLGNQEIYVHPDDHIFDAISSISRTGIPFVPVVDKTLEFLGCVTGESILGKISEYSSFNSPGGIIVLSIKENDYSLAELARIVESDNAKIVSCHIQTKTDESSALLVTLKINKVRIAGVISTLERFGYHIIATFKCSEKEEDELKRFGLLMKYINM